jgi:fructosamine-3-kinase
MRESGLRKRIELALGAHIVESRPLGVGFGLTGLEVRLSDGSHLAVKAREERSGQRAGLDLEAYMLNELVRLSEFPVPHVHYADADLLVMDFIENDGGGITTSVERHAAELIAKLHATPRERFGYARDTLIGPLPQPNPESPRWVPFFRDHRLLYMAEKARAEGSLPSALYARIERLAERIEDYPRAGLPEPAAWRSMDR